mmetsp:Transcript_25859/g.56209  ORF Transcript_25859/g.56209 Transcript_25859/m.56209 type:complete len:178 (-) Transcript_25859:443-976(-)
MFGADGHLTGSSMGASIREDADKDERTKTQEAHPTTRGWLSPRQLFSSPDVQFRISLRGFERCALADSLSERPDACIRLGRRSPTRASKAETREQAYALKLGARAFSFEDPLLPYVLVARYVCPTTQQTVASCLARPSELLLSGMAAALLKSWWQHHLYFVGPPLLPPDVCVSVAVS